MAAGVNGFGRRWRAGILAAVMMALGQPAQAQTGLIVPIDYELIGSPRPFGFGALPSGLGTGTNYDGIIDLNGMSIGERFAGQSVSDFISVSNFGPFDRLDGTPTGLLTLRAGAPKANLTLFDYWTVDLTGKGVISTRVGGNSSREYPDWSAIAEGAVSLLFADDLPEFGLSIGGGNGGWATLAFYRRDGWLLDAITVRTGTGYPDYFGFRRTNGLADIAGVSITNDDTEGVDYGDFVLGTAGPTTTVPEPGSLALTSLGMLLVVAYSRRRAIRRQHPEPPKRAPRGREQDSWAGTLRVW